MTDRLVTGSRRDSDATEASLRPQSLAEFIGQEQARANLSIFIKGGARPRRGARPRAVRRTARSRQDDAGADHVEGARGGLPRHLRPGHRQGGRPCGAADQPGRSRRPLHRRDPPPQPSRRGDPLPGTRGLPTRPHHRRRAGSTLGAHRPRQVHAHRCDDAAWASDDAAKRPLRYSRASQLLYRRGTGARRHARRAGAGDGDRPGWRARDRAACAWDAAYRRPAVAPRA